MIPSMNILSDMPSNGYNPARVALDPNDPDYLKKLGLVGMVEGHHELSAGNLQDEEPQSSAQDAPPAMGQTTPNSTAQAPKAETESSPIQPLGAPPMMGMPTSEAEVNDPYRGFTPPSGMGHGGVLGVLSRIGNIAGDVFAPGTMALIPGTQLYGERQRAIEFGRGQQALKTQIELEREQEEADYRRSMAESTRERTDTGAKAEAEKEAEDKWRNNWELGNQNIQAAREKYEENIGNKKYDAAVQSFQEHVREFNKNWDLSKDKFADEQARTGIMEEGMGIRQEAQNLAQQMAQMKDVNQRAELAKGIIEMGQEKIGGAYLFEPDILETARQYATAVPKASAQGTAAQPAAKSPTRPKGVPAGAKWNEKTHTWQL